MKIPYRTKGEFPGKTCENCGWKGKSRNVPYRMKCEFWDEDTKNDGICNQWTPFECEDYEDCKVKSKEGGKS